MRAPGCDSVAFFIYLFFLFQGIYPCGFVCVCVCACVVCAVCVGVCI